MLPSTEFQIVKIKGINIFTKTKTKQPKQTTQNAIMDAATHGAKL